MDLPKEVLNLFDKYVHGEIDRRGFLDGASKFAIGGITAAAMFEFLRPNYALAQQVPANDQRVRTEYVTIDSRDGYGKVRCLLARHTGFRHIRHRAGVQQIPESQIKSFPYGLENVSPSVGPP